MSRKCLLKQGIAMIEQVADCVEVQEISKQLDRIRDGLLPTLTKEQRQLFKQYDDLTVTESGAQINQALRLVCRCGEC